MPASVSPRCSSCSRWILTSLDWNSFKGSDRTQRECSVWPQGDDLGSSLGTPVVAQAHGYDCRLNARQSTVGVETPFGAPRSDADPARAPRAELVRPAQARFPS